MRAHPSHLGCQEFCTPGSLAGKEGACCPLDGLLLPPLKHTTTLSHLALVGRGLGTWADGLHELPKIGAAQSGRQRRGLQALGWLAAACSEAQHHPQKPGFGGEGLGTLAASSPQPLMCTRLPCKPPDATKGKAHTLGNGARSHCCARCCPTTLPAAPLPACSRHQTPPIRPASPTG